MGHEGSGSAGAEEVILPCVEPVSIYAERPDLLPHLYTFPDRGGESMLCLRPEGTAMCQLLAQNPWKLRRDFKIFYTARCWRYVRPQLGHHFEFTQFGFEWLNPRKPEGQDDAMQALALSMVSSFTPDCVLRPSMIPRGLSLESPVGFQIDCDQLEKRRLICNGGSYPQGCGFEIVIDRIMMAME